MFFLFQSFKFLFVNLKKKFNETKQNSFEIYKIVIIYHGETPGERNFKLKNMTTLTVGMF